jgi:hypothetical protein
VAAILHESEFVGYFLKWSPQLGKCISRAVLEGNKAGFA